VKILDPHDPFFEKLWVRWATVIVPMLACAGEFWMGSPGWGMLFGAAGAYAWYQLFIVRARK
jgi:hypothetical protein